MDAHSAAREYLQAENGLGAKREGTYTSMFSSKVLALSFQDASILIIHQVAK
jgi:hypothetical protein